MNYPEQSTQFVCDACHGAFPLDKRQFTAERDATKPSGARMKPLCLPCMDALLRERHKARYVEITQMSGDALLDRFERMLRAGAGTHFELVWVKRELKKRLSSEMLL